VLQLDNSAQRGPHYDELLERAAYTDADGEWLDGGANYTLRVPKDPPAKLFWSATV
jgi:hypothetical protein